MPGGPERSPGGAEHCGRRRAQMKNEKQKRKAQN